MRWLLRLHEAWRRLLLPDVEGLYGQDMEDVLEERLRRCRRRHGRSRMLLLWSREMVDVARAATNRRSQEHRGGRAMDGMRRDLKVGVRTLLRRPGFAAVLVVTLALGIGATTAIFSVVHAVLLRPLPYPDEERVMTVWTQFPTQDLMEFPASAAEFVDYREATRSFEHLAGYITGSATITESGDPDRIRTVRATRELFPALGVAPARGRIWGPEEDVAGAPVALISHRLWRDRFGGEPEIVDRTIRLDGQARRILGVMPVGFAFPEADTDAWLPSGLDPANPGGRANHGVFMVGRLRADVSREEALSELTGLMERWQADPSITHAWGGPGHPAFLRPLREQIVGPVERPLLVLMGAVGLVLLIACANVANLLLVRAEGRTREMAVREAMGAGRRRLFRQLLTESVFLGVVGGAAGVAMAWLGVQGLVALAPAELPRIDGIGIHGPVITFALAASLLAGLLFGIAPALQAGRGDVQTALREDARGGTAGGRRLRLRNLLVVGEIAVALVLLVGSGLLLRSFWELRSVDPGFQAEGLLSARVTLPGDAYPEPEDVTGFYRDLLARLDGIPGVEAATAVRVPPLGGPLPPNDVGIDGRSFDPSAGDPIPNADIQVVTPGFFESLGIPLREGRTFDRGDDEQAPVVAVVSESLADRLWQGDTPLGERIRQTGAETEWAEVVGIVGDVRQEELDAPPRGILYLVHAQSPRTWFPVSSMNLLVQASIPPLAILDPVLQEIRAMDPSLPLYQVGTLAEVVDQATATERFLAMVQLVFAGVALALAAVGIYGVVAYAAAQRTREIGIRIALGADRRRVLGLVARQGLALVAVAVAVGLVGAALVGRLLDGLVYGITPRDPLTWGAVTGVLVTVAMLACLIPALRATGVDPRRALNSD